MFPCKGCTDRYVGCHSKCDKYQQERKKLDDFKTNEAAGKQVDSDRCKHRNECLAMYSKRLKRNGRIQRIKWR